MQEVIRHYDALVAEGNDPARDPEPLRSYMDRWDGAPFLKELSLTPQSNVLEIGVGTGRLALRVRPKCNTFTGIDFSPQSILRAVENLGQGAPAVLICDDFLQFDFRCTYHVIYSSLTFFHISRKGDAIAKVASLLKDGGRFVLSLDRNPADRLVYEDRHLPLYPDDPAGILSLCSAAGLSARIAFRTEAAVVIVAEK